MNESLDKPDMNREWAEQASVVIDPRIAELWAALWEREQPCLPVDDVAGFLRLAYLSGYHDSLSDPVRGALFRRLGLRVPRRVKQTSEGPRGSL